MAALSGWWRLPATAQQLQPVLAPVSLSLRFKSTQRARDSGVCVTARVSSLQRRNAPLVEPLRLFLRKLRAHRVKVHGEELIVKLPSRMELAEASCGMLAVMYPFGTRLCGRRSRAAFPCESSLVRAEV